MVAEVRNILVVYECEQKKGGGGGNYRNVNDSDRKDCFTA